MKRTVFIVSDGTGITAETVGRALLSHFAYAIDFQYTTVPYVDTVEKAQRLRARIDAAAALTDAQPLVISTIVNAEVRETIFASQSFHVDVLSTFLTPLEQELATPSSLQVGKHQSIAQDIHYQVRINAVHFALENDDGARVRDYDAADVILVGVSRCGKTPTCLYLGMQFGIKAANYPITEDDLQELVLPEPLRNQRTKLYGLTIEPDHLAAIRTERRPGSQYASLRQCEEELRNAEAMFRRFGVPVIDTTHYSVEEISTRILNDMQLERRVH